MQVYTEGVRGLNPSSRLHQPFKRRGTLEIQGPRPPHALLASPSAVLVQPARSPVDDRIVRESVFYVSLSLLKFLKNIRSNKYKFRMYKSLGTESSLWDTHIYRYQL